MKIHSWAIAAMLLFGLSIGHPGQALAQDCGGPLSSSTGNIVGSLGGAAAGGLLGSQFGGGSGKGVMTGLGVVGGALAGGYVGRQAEGCNRPRQRAAAQGAHPVAAGRTCRAVTTEGTIGGQQQTLAGVACLDPDGVWRTATDPAAQQSAQIDLVLRTQQQLHDKGFYVRNNVDGRWGPATSGALSNYQRANGLAPTGQIDAPTRTALGLDPVPLTELTAQNAAPAQDAAQPAAQPTAATTPASASQNSIYK